MYMFFINFLTYGADFVTTVRSGMEEQDALATGDSIRVQANRYRICICVTKYLSVEECERRTLTERSITKESL